jgi:hypothetical protein
MWWKRSHAPAAVIATTATHPSALAWLVAADVPGSGMTAVCGMSDTRVYHSGAVRTKMRSGAFQNTERLILSSRSNLNEKKVEAPAKVTE